MKLTSAGYEQIGKVFLAIGQGIVLASLIAAFLGGQGFHWLSIIAVAVGIVFIYVGIWYIELSVKLKREEP